MKNIYPIAIYQDIEYKIFLLPIRYNFWVIGNLHYILAENEDEAIQIYKDRYQTFYNKELNISDIYKVSDDYYPRWSNKRTKIENTIVHCGFIHPTAEMLFKDMNINDFKEYLNCKY